MSSTSESGHAINLANFDTLISFVKGYGEVYNPTKNSIKVESLETIFVNSKQAIEAVDNVKPANTNAVSARRVAFAPLNKLITRVNNAIKATDNVDNISGGPIIAPIPISAPAFAPAAPTPPPNSAINGTIASGNAVPTATKIDPVTPSEIPNFSPTCSRALQNIIAATKIKIIPRINWIKLTIKFFP